LPASTCCIAAAAVIALVIDAIQKTVSRVIAAGLPMSRLPKAPSYKGSPRTVAAATTPATSPASAAWRRA
jgi:hypothetical protein